MDVQDAIQGIVNTVKKKKKGDSQTQAGRQTYNQEGGGQQGGGGRESKALTSYDKHSFNTSDNPVRPPADRPSNVARLIYDSPRHAMDNKSRLYLAFREAKEKGFSTVQHDGSSHGQSEYAESKTSYQAGIDAMPTI